MQGDQSDGFSNNSSCTVWNAVGFSLAMGGGNGKGLLQLHLDLSKLDHILFHRISSNIAKHLLWRRTEQDDFIGHFNKAICTINGEVNENKSSPKRNQLRVSILVLPALKSLLFSLTDRLRKNLSAMEIRKCILSPLSYMNTNFFQK